MVFAEAHGLRRRRGVASLEVGIYWCVAILSQVGTLEFPNPDHACRTYSRKGKQKNGCTEAIPTNRTVDFLLTIMPVPSDAIGLSRITAGRKGCGTWASRAPSARRLVSLSLGLSLVCRTPSVRPRLHDRRLPSTVWPRSSLVGLNTIRYSSVTPRSSRIILRNCRSPAATGSSSWSTSA